jgi:hypothetical protein
MVLPVVITKARAVALVEAQLVSLAVANVERHALGWLVSCQSAEYLSSRDWTKQLVGQGPYLVDGQDGSIHYIPITTFLHADWARMYLEDVKGIRLRTRCSLRFARSPFGTARWPACGISAGRRRRCRFSRRRHTSTPYGMVLTPRRN